MLEFNAVLLATQLLIVTVAAAADADAVTSIDVDHDAPLTDRAPQEIRLLDPSPVSEQLSLSDATISLAEIDDIQPMQQPFGEQHTWRINILGGAAFEFEDAQNIFVEAGVGFSYFVIDNFSIDVEFNGMYINQDGSDAGAGNINFLMRWHFLSRETWSLYADGGAGLMLASAEVPGKSPNNGSNFNFTPQAGLGATFDIGNSNRLMLGVRAHHMSNANLYDDNAGRDSLLGYIGVSMPF